jgi:transcriptional regulator with XRE-family HTH domain
MAVHTQPHETTQTDDDILRLSLALREEMKDRNCTSLELSAATGVPEANIRRMMRGQEPKVSFLAAAERYMGSPLGTIIRRAGLNEIEADDTAALIESDPDLLPVFKVTGAEQYRHWVKLSKEMSRPSQSATDLTNRKPKRIK